MFLRGTLCGYGILICTIIAILASCEVQRWEDGAQNDIETIITLIWSRYNIMGEPIDLKVPGIAAVYYPALNAVALFTYPSGEFLMLIRNDKYWHLAGETSKPPWMEKREDDIYETER